MIKKTTYIFLLVILIMFLISSNYFKTYGSNETNSILESQMEALNLSSFIKEGEKYTKDVFPEVNLRNFFNLSISGNIDNSGVLNGILNTFTSEIRSTTKTLATVLIIIVIHSILKAISENVENKGVSQVAYYVQYILIIAVVMGNFTDIINTVYKSITNLILFINMLIPILLALVTVTRKCCNKYNVRTNNYTYSSFYWKYNNKRNTSNPFYLYSYIYNF